MKEATAKNYFENYFENIETTKPKKDILMKAIKICNTRFVLLEELIYMTDTLIVIRQVSILHLLLIHCSALLEHI